ncbi:hypothetical protein [Pseudonocardia zijingensis]|uniref:Uncharacterized protein n=1 Tax=Pseudonocardia zijingensis TaxID=153376 RepID=A0ABN1N935_9PSEU
MTDETTARNRAEVVERALKMQEGSVLAREVLRMRALAGVPTADVATTQLAASELRRAAQVIRSSWRSRSKRGAAHHLDQRAAELEAAAPEGVDAATEPTYRHTRERRPGEPVDPAADLARYDAVLARTPEGCPGRGLMLAHREQLAREVARVDAGRRPRVAGRCPSCHGTSLFLGAGGHVTCSRLDCPAPCTADDLLHPESPAPVDVAARFRAAAERAGPVSQTTHVETDALLAVMSSDEDRVQDLLGEMTPQQLLRFSEQVEKLWHAIRRARWRGGAWK